MRRSCSLGTHWDTSLLDPQVCVSLPSLTARARLFEISSDMAGYGDIRRCLGCVVRLLRVVCVVCVVCCGVRPLQDSSEGTSKASSLTCHRVIQYQVGSQLPHAHRKPNCIVSVSLRSTRHGSPHAQRTGAWKKKLTTRKSSELATRVRCHADHMDEAID